MKEDNSKFNTTYPSTVPKQKLATSQKGLEWCKNNLLYWERRLVDNNSIGESSKVNMKRNSNMYLHNILDPADIEKICNQARIKDFTIPPDFKHYKIEHSKIQTLKGEELKRIFEWKVYVSNREAISKKEEDKKNEFYQFLLNKIKSESVDEAQLQVELDKLNEFLTYDWQDLREKTADELLHHYNQYLDLKTEFSKAWEFALINSEEIMSVDEFNGKPVVKACDPKTIYWRNEGSSIYIDDADAVVEKYYAPLGQVIDCYYEYLTPKEIDKLEARQNNIGEYRNFTYNQYYTKTDKGFIIDNNKNGEIVIADGNYQDCYDDEGNIRIIHCRWKSLRKIGELSYFDEDGTQQSKHVDENYKINVDAGETIEWYWVNEAWEATRIGEDIYVKCKPRSVQFRKLDNISYCSLGYIGTSLNNGIFDLMKDYSIKYDAYMWRTEQAMIKSIGKIGELDLSLIPDGWDIDMWMHFAHNMGWAVIDSFKEGKKGAAMGKLAGQGSSRGNVINMEQGQFIQQNMLMMQYLEGQLNKLIGINPSREGIVSPDTGLQVNREAIQNSSNITESYFAIHDNVKLRTLRALLEVSKYCLRNKTESIQYITSEMTSKIFEVDGKMINEAEFGLLVGNATDDAAMISKVQAAAEVGFQTGVIDLVQLMDIFSSDSTSNKRRKIEKSVRLKQEKEQAQIEQQNQIEQAKLQQASKQHQELLNDKQADRDLEQYKIDKGFEEAIQVEEIRVFAKQKELDLNHNGIPDPMEIADKALRQQEIDSNRFTEQSKIIQKQVEIKDKKDLASRKLDIEEQKVKVELKNQKNDLDIAKLNAKNRSKK